MYEEHNVKHPHGNLEAKPSHGAHAGKEGHGEAKTHVRDPGGATSTLSHGGSLPGGTEGGKTHTKESKGTV
jgi:hypothetical protein